MPSSPARRHASSPARRTGQSGSRSTEPPRTPTKPIVPSAPRRTQSYTPHTNPNSRDRPAPARRHTTQMQPHSNRALPPLPAKIHASSPSPTRRHTNSSPTPAAAVRGQGAHGPHVLIPVPIRARDAESPSFIRAPSGQRVDFVFSPPKKRGLIGRLLDSVEWTENGSQANKPYRYRKPTPKTPTSRPFYKRLLP